jgi:hypothetical protein
MAEKARMQEAEMNIGNRGSLLECGNRKGLNAVIVRAWLRI